MVTFAIAGVEFDIPRNLALLDTNILISYAYEGDKNHHAAVLFIEHQDAFVLGIAPPVIAEACSFLIGRLKRRDRAEWLLRWLLTPGTGARLLPSPHDLTESGLQNYLSADSGWMRQYDLDYVDAFLMQMANVITLRCTFKPDLVIVTSDLKDFLKCYGQGYAYRLYDITSGDIISDETV